MSTFLLQIELGSSAMDSPADVAAALRKAANQVEQAGAFVPLDGTPILDLNGNVRGHWGLVPDEDEEVES